MSCTTEGVVGEWNPDIPKGGSFNPIMLITDDGVIGYDPADTFVGWIYVDEDDPDTHLVDYDMVETNPVSGLLTPTLTVAKTDTLPLGLLFHVIKWTKTSTGEVFVIDGRPNVKG